MLGPLRSGLQPAGWFRFLEQRAGPRTYPDRGRRTCKCHRSLRISPRRAFADPAASPSPFAFHVQRRFGKLARVTSPRSASESRSPSSESGALACLRAGRSSATTSSRSVTKTVSPLRTSRRYSDNLDFSCLTPTDFIVFMVATGGYKINCANT